MAMIGLRNAGTLFRRIIVDRQAEFCSGFRDDPGVPHGELTGKTVGLIGCGIIGRRLLELLEPFHTTTYVYDPYVPRELADVYDVTFTSLDNVLSLSDVVICLAPITPATRGMLGAREFDLMHDEAVFVNVSRGAIVQTDALIAKLREGKLIASLDVFDPEPFPVDSPIRDLPNVFLTPHIAGGRTPPAARASSRSWSTSWSASSAGTRPATTCCRGPSRTGPARRRPAVSDRRVRARRPCIAGGGAAACVLAARLSEDPGRRVLVLEAGPDYPDTATTPAMVRYGWGDASIIDDPLDLDWAYLRHRHPDERRGLDPARSARRRLGVDQRPDLPARPAGGHRALVRRRGTARRLADDGRGVPRPRGRRAVPDPPLGPVPTGSSRRPPSSRPVSRPDTARSTTTTPPTRWVPAPCRSTRTTECAGARRWPT